MGEFYITFFQPLNTSICYLWAVLPATIHSPIYEVELNQTGKCSLLESNGTPLFQTNLKNGSNYTTCVLSLTKLIFD